MTNMAIEQKFKIYRRRKDGEEVRLNTAETDCATAFDYGIELMDWEREPTKFSGITSSVGRHSLEYTPDFFSNELGAYVEVKGVRVTTMEKDKFYDVTDRGYRLFVIDSNGFVYVATRAGLWSGFAFRCLSCNRVYFAMDAHETCPHCNDDGARKIKLGDNLFSISGQSTFGNFRKFPMGRYDETPDVTWDGNNRREELTNFTFRNRNRNETEDWGYAEDWV